MPLQSSRGVACSQGTSENELFSLGWCQQMWTSSASEISSVDEHSQPSMPPCKPKQDWRNLEHDCLEVVRVLCDFCKHCVMPHSSMHMHMLLQGKDTLFYGARKYIEDLWQIIKSQTLRIARLEQMVSEARKVEHQAAHAPGEYLQKPCCLLQLISKHITIRAILPHSSCNNVPSTLCVACRADCVCQHPGQCSTA